jgi:hypothetical protein
MAFIYFPLLFPKSQKDLFKAMHETVDVRGHQMAGGVHWVTGHCYVIDVFLWFMPRRGYTLQRSRANHDFYDLSNTIDMANRRRLESLRHVFRKDAQSEQDPKS